MTQITNSTCQSTRWFFCLFEVIVFMFCMCVCDIIAVYILDSCNCKHWFLCPAVWVSISLIGPGLCWTAFGQARVSALQICSNMVCRHLIYANVVNPRWWPTLSCPESSVDGGLPRLRLADDYAITRLNLVAKEALAKWSVVWLLSFWANKCVCITCITLVHRYNYVKMAHTHFQQYHLFNFMFSVHNTSNSHTKLWSRYIQRNALS